MFHAGFKEKDQPEVTVGDVDEASFPETNVAMIARLADRYQVSSLLVRCVIPLQNDDAIANIEKLLLLEELAQRDALM
ncbi:hypothetical protein AAVH_23697 [Aphelenchoides avenae]|nr:hypothetical protein AAVH_23697 [Aphelenchus avenae]